MVLPTRIIEVDDVNPRIFILYSAPKMGKTTLISQLENCLLVDLENGSNYVRGLKLKINSLEELEKMCLEIEKAKNPYKYIAIDTISQLEDWCEMDATMEYMKSTQGKMFNRVLEKGVVKDLPAKDWQSVLSLPNGAGYLWLRLCIQKWLERIYSLSEYTILIGHLRDKMVEFKGTEVSAKALDLTGKVASIVCARADAVGFLYRDEEETHINFESKDTILCGARPDHLKGKDIIVSEEKNGETIYHWDRIYKTV